MTVFKMRWHPDVVFPSEPRYKLMAFPEIPVMHRPPLDHWSEIAPKDLERTLNVLPVPGALNGCHYLITSGHWLDLLASTDRELVCGEVHAVLASCTSHEAALAAFRLLQGTP